MGYELYREVKIWAPATLTHREKLTALVIADDALDETRLTWSSVVDPEIMRQAMVKNQRDMLKVVARLQDEKIIEHAGGGHNGAVAKYRFLHLAPPTMKGVEKEHPTGGVGGPKRTPYGPGADQKEHPTDAEGCSNPPGRVSKTNTPTPSTPSTTTPSSSAGSGSSDEKPKRGQRKPAAAGEDVPLPRPDVDAICDHLADVLVKTGSSKPTITAAWRKAARLLLDKDGITVDQAQRAIDWALADDFWQAHILTPMKLREKYDTLRRKATAERKHRGSVREPVATPDDWQNNQVEIDL